MAEIQVLSLVLAAPTVQSPEILPSLPRQASTPTAASCYGCLHKCHGCCRTEWGDLLQILSVPWKTVFNDKLVEILATNYVRWWIITSSSLLISILQEVDPHGAPFWASLVCKQKSQTSFLEEGNTKHPAHLRQKSKEHSSQTALCAISTQDQKFMSSNGAQRLSEACRRCCRILPANCKPFRILQRAACKHCKVQKSQKK